MSILHHFPIGWDEVRRDATTLATMLSEKGKWHGIVAITRGGLTPASLVARALGIRLIETVSVEAYDGDRPLDAPLMLKPPTAAGDGDGWLIIDDLVDTGITMQLVRAALPKAHAGVLYAKPVGRAFADTFVREFPQDLWIDFPWEVDQI